MSTSKNMRGLLLLFCLSIFSLVVNGQDCTVNAGVPQSICASETLQLQGGQNGSISTNAVWSQVSGPTIIISDPNSLTPTIQGLSSVVTNADVQFTFRITATCSDGTLTFQDVTHTVKPITIADAGSNLGNQCPASPPSLSANAVGTGETGEWSIVGNNNAGVSFSSASSPTTSITLDDDDFGTSTLRWTITNSNGCTSSDDITITNLGGETPVSAGSDKTLDNCYTVSQSTKLSASRGGNGTGGQDGLWVVVSGPNTPTFNDNTRRDATVSNLREGTYTLRWEVSGPCATGSDEMTITVPAPTQDVTDARITDNNGRLIYCDGRTEVTLVGNVPGITNETSQWTQVSGPSGVVFNSPTSAITTVSGLDGSSEYRFRYTITSPLSASCNSSDDVRVQYVAQPTISITEGDFVELSCDDNSQQINFTETGGNNIQWRIISGPSTTNWKTDNSSPINVTGLSDPGTYTVRVRNRSQNSIDCPIAFDDINLVVADSPTPSNAGTDQNLLPCGTTLVELVGNDPTLNDGVGDGSWSLVSGPVAAVTFSNATAFETDVTNPGGGALPAGTYVFRWIIDAGSSCGTAEDDVQVIIGEVITGVMADKTGATSIGGVCAGSTVTMNATEAPAGGTGTWTVVTGGTLTFADANDPETDVSGFTSGQTYRLRWSVVGNAGCGDGAGEIDIVVSTENGPSDADAGADQCVANTATSFSLTGSDPSSGTGTWSVINQPGGAVPSFSPNANDRNATVGGTLPDGDYTFRWTISGGAGCTDRSDDVTTTKSQTASTADAGSDQRICVSNGTATFAAVAPTTGTGTWSQKSGPGGATITSTSLHNSTVTGLVPGIYVFTWTVGSGSCPTTSDEVKIEVSEPVTTPNAGADQNVCGTSATMAGNAITSGTGVWSLVGENPNTPTITSINSPTTTITGLITGTYTFRWSAVGDPFCSVETDDVTLTVIEPAEAGSNQQLCDQTTTILTGNDNTTGTWTFVSGPATPTINAAGNNAANVTNMTTNGTYTFRYTYNGSLAGAPGCAAGEDTDVVTVEIFAKGTQPAAGADQSLCDATNFSLNALAGTGTWTVLSKPSGSPTPNFSDANSATSTVSNITFGIYLFQWEVTNGACTFTDNVRIENFESPTTANAGADQMGVCPPDVTLAATAVTIGTGKWTVVSTPASATTPVFSSDLSPTATVTFVEPGAYTLRWTTSNKDASGNGCPDSTDDVVITIANAAPTTANAGSDQQICAASTATLAGNDPGSFSGQWTFISGPTTPSITSANLFNSGVTGMSNQGDYVFRWTITSDGTDATNPCTSADDVTISVFDNPTADAGSDQTFCQFQSFTLQATAPTVGTGTWSFVSGPNTVSFANASQASTALIGIQPSATPYVFRWTVSNGNCTDATDDVSITVLQDVEQAVAGTDSTYKNTTVIKLQGADPDTVTNNPTGTWTVVSSPSGVTPVITDASDHETTVTGLSSGRYEFQWQFSNGTCTTEDRVVININEPPTLDLDGDNSSGVTGNDYESSYLLSTPEAVGDTDVVIADNDNTNMSFASIILTNRLDGTSETLSVNGSLPTGITASTYNSSNGTITLSGSASIANYQTAIRQIVYDNTLSAPDETDRRIEVLVSDGLDSTNVAVATIKININNAPTSSDKTISLLEDQTYTFSNDDFAFNDSDGNSFSRVQIDSLPKTGTLSYNGTALNASNLNSTNYTDRTLFTFAPLADEFASPYDSIYFKVRDNGGTVNNGVDSSAVHKITLNVLPVNDEPSFTGGADQTINEDAGAQTVPSWATSFSKGPSNESSQTLTLTATNDNNGLFSVQPVVSTADGTLTYTPAADSVGSATVSLVLKDDGGTENGGDDTYQTVTFKITILPVNDAPGITLGANEEVLEDAGAQTKTNWATNIIRGPANENTQSLTITSTNDNNGLFTSQPQIDTTGTLTYTAAPDSFGVATVTVLLGDNGGTSSGGQNALTAGTFTITVIAVNDEPSFTGGPDQTVANDAGAQSVSAWASAFSKGPANESGQSLTLSSSNDNNNLFSEQPAVGLDGTLTYTPNPEVIGTANVALVLQDDGGTANGGDDTFETVTFQITTEGDVANNPPVAVNDTVIVSEGDNIDIFILENDSDPDGDELTITFAESQNGAVVTIVDGVLQYTAPDAFCGTDIIDYTICDPGPLCASAQVIITVTPDDTDGDGIYDFLETISADTDEDGIPNYQDLDSDNDGIADKDEVIFIDECTIEFPDSDNDGLEDYFDADIVVFNSFTPDGDGVNDQWVIEDIESFPDNTVRLFNRWGNLIYEETGYNNQDRAWNAERTNGVGFGSDRVPDGTYFYVIDLGDGSPSRSGFVVIKR